MSEKMLYMKEHFDYVRKMLTSEPRGTDITSVAVLTEPTIEEADIGAFYFESHGYMPMCGHDTIGLGTMLVETGMVEVTEPITKITIETPAGLVKLRVAVENGRARSVTFRNAECFTFDTDMQVEYQGKKIKFDVAYGGNFYAIMDVKEVGLSVGPQDYKKLVRAGTELIDIINAKYNITHPEKKYLHGVTHMQFTDPAVLDNGTLKSKNAVAFLPGDLDRSPCGTGTSARTALLYTKGILKIGQEFQHKSFIDSLFISHIVEETDYYGYKAVIPEITGSAHVVGFGTILLDPDDDKGYGFKIG
jgi:proline racemase